MANTEEKKCKNCAHFAPLGNGGGECYRSWFEILFYGAPIVDEECVCKKFKYMKTALRSVKQKQK